MAMEAEKECWFRDLRELDVEHVETSNSSQKEIMIIKNMQKYCDPLSMDLFSHITRCDQGPTNPTLVTK